jgi:hypothetical protein
MEGGNIFVHNLIDFERYHVYDLFTLRESIRVPTNVDGVGEDHEDEEDLQNDEQRARAAEAVHSSFQKTLLYDPSDLDPQSHGNLYAHTQTDNDNLLSVTVASCPFSRPMPPISMMSAYLVLGASSSSSS